MLRALLRDDNFLFSMNIFLLGVTVVRAVEVSVLVRFRLLGGVLLGLLGGPETILAVVVCYVPRRPRAVICSAVSVSMCQRCRPSGSDAMPRNTNYTRACVAAPHRAHGFAACVCVNCRCARRSLAGRRARAPVARSKPLPAADVHTRRRRMAGRRLRAAEHDGAQTSATLAK